MYPVPYSALCREPRTPFWEVLALFALGTIIILAEDGDSEQITDQAGRTFYEPNLGGPPTLWEQIRRDSAGRIPQMARIPVFQAGTAPEIYYLGWENRAQPATRGARPRGGSVSLGHAFADGCDGAYLADHGRRARDRVRVRPERGEARSRARPAA